jgi:hypothetical protein
MKLTVHVRRVMRDSIRMYFAPLTGAVKGVRAEWRRAESEIQRSRNADSQVKKDAVHHA